MQCLKSTRRIIDFKLNKVNFTCLNLLRKHSLPCDNALNSCLCAYFHSSIFVLISCLAFLSSLKNLKRSAFTPLYVVSIRQLQDMMCWSMFSCTPSSDTLMNKSRQIFFFCISLLRFSRKLPPPPSTHKRKPLQAICSPRCPLPNTTISFSDTSPQQKNNCNITRSSISSANISSDFFCLLSTKHFPALPLSIFTSAKEVCHAHHGQAHS